MKRNISFSDEYAVSEIVGGLLLILIALMVFSVIYLYVFPLPIPPPEPNVDLMGYVTDDGIAVIAHMGGESIFDYKVLVNQVDGTFIDSREYKNLDPPWCIGMCKYPLENITEYKHLNETDMVEVIIYTFNKEGGESEIFRGILCGAPEDIYSGNNPILISSLRDNTPDEDLICYSYPIIPDVNATTYIYNWKRNGVSLTDLNMPFNTENNDTCKDYSGDGNDGELVKVTWSSEGIIGGSCYFNGSSQYITMDLPDVFYDIPNNDFTISLWVRSENITADNAVVLMASEDNNNFVKIFLQGSKVHIGVCDDRTRDAVKTENLSSDVWYHIAGVWDASEDLVKIYCNGTEYTLVGDENFALGSGTNLLEIGHGTASSKFWDGYMDELEIYNKALSQDQIYQIYLSTKDGGYDRRVFVSEETSIGESWQCIVTPNDGVQDGSEVTSNILQIVNYAGGN